MSIGRGVDLTVLRRALSGSVVRLVGLPIVVGAGIVNTSLVIGGTGVAAYGIVSTVAMLGALLPFSDLGVGGSVTTAVALASNSPIAALKQKLLAANALLMSVAVIIVSAASLFGILSVWSSLLGQTFLAQDDAIISFGLAMFGLTVPLGLGTRVLIGLGRNDLAVAISMTSSLFVLGSTALMTMAGTQGIAFALPSFLGPFAAGGLSTIIAYRLLNKMNTLRLQTDPEPDARGPRPERRYDFRFLAGSGALVVVTIGLPLGLETGRVMLSHVGTPIMLSQYALMAQLYAIAWSVISTSSGALWTIFAQRRGDPKESFTIWRSMVALFGLLGAAGAVFLWALGPWAGSVISQGEISIPPAVAAAFGALLIAQSLHLPAGSLLTTPRQLRMQAFCVVAMAAISLSSGLFMARSIGGAGIALGAAIGVFLGQLVPDLLLVPRVLLKGAPTRRFGRKMTQRQDVQRIQID